MGISSAGLRASARSVSWSVCFLAGVVFASPEPPPPDFKVAFLGDQGLGEDARKVLELVKSEGADLLVLLGDFDYQDNPPAWEERMDSILGKDFPVIAVVGNHDLPAWPGPRGYSSLIAARLRRMGIEVRGEAGARCSFRYRGIFFVLVAPGLFGTGHGDFIRRELASDSSLWRICAWHVDQRLMQVGGKGDEAGWDVYEESRKGGAIIATAHEHSYSRTHLLSSMQDLKVAARGDTLRVRPGYTFAFVSGLGGEEVRPQSLGGDWWASIYTAGQNAAAGALFATFHVDGDPRKAEFVFKAVNGAVPDRFIVYSDTAPSPRRGPPRTPAPTDSLAPPEPHWQVDPSRVGLERGGRLDLLDLKGRIRASFVGVASPVTLPLPRSGLWILRIVNPGGRSVRKLILVP
jgi:hypothetical protein